MKEILPSLFQTASERPFFNDVKTCAYLLVRPEGNLILYSSSKIKKYFSFIEEKGKLVRQYVNHRDEASKYCDVVADKFGAPLLCHELEKEAISKKCRVGQTFKTRTFVEPDFEAIPTPGHCPGSTCYLWHRKDRKILFTGDTIYPARGTWNVRVDKSNEETMIQSLRLLKTLEFDVLIPSLFIGEVSYQVVSSDERLKLLDECILKLSNN